MNIYPNILSNGKVLVIGASGFVGRNLYEHLKNCGIDVSGTCFSKDSKELINRDLTDYNQVKELVGKFDYVFMCAAKTYGAGLCTNSPEALVRESVIMNANVFHACYETGVKKVLFISSSVVYQESFKELEESDLDLNKPVFPLYHGVGWVKRYAEKLAEFYASLGLNIIIVRPTNIYGKYDKHEEGKSHFIPAIIKRCLSAKDELYIWGTGNNVKDLMYIDDFIIDIIKLFDVYNSCEPVNICSGVSYTIRDVVNTICSACGYFGSIKYDPSAPGSVPYKKISRNKLDTIIGKREYKTLSYGIIKTVDWIKNDIINHN